MGMLPVFIIGLLTGVAVAWAFYSYKKDVPSATRVKFLEDELKCKNDDNEMLHNLVEKLYAKIEKLEKEK